MELRNKYYYFTEALSTRFCNDVIDFALKQKDKDAVVGEKNLEKFSKKELKEVKKNTRDSKITWLQEPWMYREIKPYLEDANRLAHWNFDFDWIESLQFTKYAKNQFYTWHTDAFPDSYKSSSSTHNNKIRKLSFICQLSNPNKYKGGEVDFVIPKMDKTKLTFSAYQLKEIIPQGSIVVFPSFVWHRVRPVTKGVRHSLVSWALGFPFK